VAWWNIFKRHRTRQPQRPSWLVAGLGNPGPEYEASRHNFGFRAADALVRSGGGGWTRRSVPPMDSSRVLTGDGVSLEVIRPLSFMNRSGGPVSEALGSCGLNTDRLIVLVDDLALPLGTLRIRQGGGDGGHNGLRSVAEVLGDSLFIRVRLGVAPAGGMPPAGEWVDFVLGSFADGEEEDVRRVADRAVEAVAAIVSEGPLPAMSRFNRRK
jgi:PTH1 family peptidyl-tRNA hydrolase